MHGTSKPRPLGARLLCIKSPSLPVPVYTPLSTNCAVGIPRQGHELAQATSSNTHHASLLIIKLTFLMTMLSNSLVPRTVVPLCKPCRHLCVCGTLSQTCINTDMGMCFKLLDTSRVESRKSFLLTGMKIIFPKDKG